MRKHIKYTIICLFLSASLLTGNSSLYAQQERYTMRGTVTDASNGENLIGANVTLSDASRGATTNSYGFYSLNLPKGRYKITFSYIGYTPQEVEVELYGERKVNISLEPVARSLDEVVVHSRAGNANVASPDMSLEKLSSATIKSMPALMGEVDVIKAIQLLPGVQATSEGSSGFSVRGGGFDQNLILLDEATVYNASHLMGFFSVFNNDAVKDVTLYKGDIPASFGGRLSSLLDIRTKDGNNRKFSGSGGIGLISSRLMLEGPIAKGKASYLISGRRTYADLFLKLASDRDLRSTVLYFYDLNMKFNYHVSDNNRIYLAGYMGSDKFGNRATSMTFGNMTGTLRWNHIFSPRLFSNFTLLASRYNYGLYAKLSEQTKQRWDSNMQDYGVKGDLVFNINPRNTMRFGYALIYHTFVPGKGGGVGENAPMKDLSLPKEYALEQAAYISDEMTLGEKFTIKYGLRFSMFQNISNGEPVYTLKDYKEESVETYRKGKIFCTQYRFEPRVGAVYMFDNNNSVKASYNRAAQYIQIASNSSAGSPFDIWFQATNNVKPQMSDQYSVGYFRNLKDDQYEISMELYYKNMRDLVDFRDHAKLFFTDSLEREIRTGKGYAYGMELMVRKNTGKLTGWISYTISKAKRKVDEVNEGRWYRSPYDKPHNISAVASYELNRKWRLSASWVFASGTPVTYPEGRYLVENEYIPIPSARNAYRYPSYHRLDLSATWKLTDKKKRFKSELDFSLYNAYGRKNPWAIYFDFETKKEGGPPEPYAEMLYLFRFVPSVTWNFTF